MFKRKNRDRKDKLEQKRRRMGMLLSVLLMFVMVLLSSSFILRFIYEGASNVEITQSGIADVFRAAMGDGVFIPDDYYDEDEEYEYYEYSNGYTGNSSTTDDRDFVYNGDYNPNYDTQEEKESIQNSNASDEENFIVN